MHKLSHFSERTNHSEEAENSTPASSTVFHSPSSCRPAQMSYRGESENSHEDVIFSGYQGVHAFHSHNSQQLEPTATTRTSSPILSLDTSPIQRNTRELKFQTKKKSSTLNSSPISSASFIQSTGSKLDEPPYTTHNEVLVDNLQSQYQQNISSHYSDDEFSRYQQSPLVKTVYPQSPTLHAILDTPDPWATLDKILDFSPRLVTTENAFLGLENSGSSGLLNIPFKLPASSSHTFLNDRRTLQPVESVLPTQDATQLATSPDYARENIEPHLAFQKSTPSFQASLSERESVASEITLSS